jgi:hypothetical protein
MAKFSAEGDFTNNNSTQVRLNNVDEFPYWSTNRLGALAQGTQTAVAIVSGAPPDYVSFYGQTSTGGGSDYYGPYTNALITKVGTGPFYSFDKVVFPQ